MEEGFHTEELQEKEYAQQTLERYSGSPIAKFRSNLLLTNFPRYVDHFSKMTGAEVFEGAMFKVAHCPKEDITMVDFKIGTTAAALVVDLCAFLPVRSAVMLGMCAGLRRRYRVGEYFVPVASIRDEGTSNFYFPPEVPALGNFFMQKAVTDVLEESKENYHIGITHSSNVRFWEFNEEFKRRLQLNRAQAYELECATLFAASYKKKFTLGALLLISDLPLNRDGIKTKKSSEHVYNTFMPDHIEKGVAIIKKALEKQARQEKGSYHRNLVID